MLLADSAAPAPAVKKAALAFLLLLSAVFHLSPAPAAAQALFQLPGYDAEASAPGVPASPPVVVRAAPGFTAYFLSVGQGDAVYLELPGGGNALIDGGPSSSASGPLAKFLASRGISRIDHVVLTHPHSDHYKGLLHVFSSYTVGRFYDTKMNNTGASGDETVRAKAAAAAAETLYPAPGDSYTWSGGVHVKVFNGCPAPAASSNGDAINGCSITMKLSYGGASMLFTGDIEGEVESALVQAFGAELDSDVLKVPHHGSQYSSSEAFLRAVSPSKAYIEVGANNYGHPTAQAIDRLLAAGAEVLRTDLSGTLAWSPAEPAAGPAAGPSED